MAQNLTMLALASGLFLWASVGQAAPETHPTSHQKDLPHGSQPALVAAANPAPPKIENDESMSRNAAARSRMLECGHQWSAKKKAGTASGTWKEFSRLCLNKT